VDPRHDEKLEAWFREGYQAAPEAPPGARERVRQAVAACPPPRPRRGPLWWLLEPKALRIRPAVAVAGACLAVALAWLGPRALGPAARLDVHKSAPGTAASAARPVSFALIAPEAHSVAVVGDFNGWDVRANPLARASESGAWVAVLPIEPGRHLYGFVVDGERWVCDPAAPLSADANFGQHNSVLVVDNTL